MKKKILTIIALVGMLSCSGCLSVYASANEANTTKPSRLMSIVEDRFFYTIYRHNETGVLYLVGTEGGVTVMVNPDGSPYVDKDD